MLITILMPSCAAVKPSTVSGRETVRHEAAAPQRSEVIVAKDKNNVAGLYVEAGLRYQVKIVGLEENIVDGDGRCAVKLHGLEGWDNFLL